MLSFHGFVVSGSFSVFCLHLMTAPGNSRTRLAAGIPVNHHLLVQRGSTGQADGRVRRFLPPQRSPTSATSPHLTAPDFVSSPALLALYVNQPTFNRKPLSRVRAVHPKCFETTEITRYFRVQHQKPSARACRFLATQRKTRQPNPMAAAFQLCRPRFPARRRLPPIASACPP